MHLLESQRTATDQLYDFRQMSSLSVSSPV